MRPRDITPEEIACEWEVRCARYAARRRFGHIIVAACIVATPLIYYGALAFGAGEFVAWALAFFFVYIWGKAYIWTRAPTYLLRCPRCGHAPAAKPPTAQPKLTVCDRCFAVLTPLSIPGSVLSRSQVHASTGAQHERRL